MGDQVQRNGIARSLHLPRLDLTSRLVFGVQYGAFGLHSQLHRFREREPEIHLSNHRRLGAQITGQDLARELRRLPGSIVASERLQGSEVSLGSAVLRRTVKRAGEIAGSLGLSSDIHEKHLHAAMDVRKTADGS